ncbi:MAG: PD-(D/E)XK nuclease family transposase [Saprospiraceae bacterium]|nr:PD-(D/E)XK nuclease family transposase [Candidatus Brachybacter algidus]
MQRGSQEYFKDRSIYYTSRVINRLVGKKRKWNYELPEVYFIGIMDFRFNDNPDRNYFHDIHLTDRTSGQEFYEKLGYIYIELPNFDKEFTTTDRIEDISELDKWIYVLKHLSHLNKAPGFLNKLIFKKLYDTELYILSIYFRIIPS